MQFSYITKKALYIFVLSSLYPDFSQKEVQEMPSKTFCVIVIFNRTQQFDIGFLITYNVQHYLV